MTDSRAALRSLTLIVLTGLALGACSGDGPDSMPTMEVARDTVGDTVFVHTASGQAWPSDATLVPEVRIGVLDGPEEYIFGRIGSLAVGPAGEIFVFDQQVPALRKYDPRGNYVTTFGREGEGPGEYKRPDGGMVVVGERLVLRDPGNARLTVYDMEGEQIGNWLVNGSFSTSDQMPWDHDGHVYTRALKDTSVPVSEWVSVLVRYDSTGAVVDSLDIPDADIPEGFIEASNENSSSRSSVPFFPGQSTEWSPLGYWVHGVSTRYGIKIYRDGEPDLVMGREYEPVPVPSSYAARRREQMTENFRNRFPGWRWNGPDIPDVMPPFQSLEVGIDGRIWVTLHQPYTEEDNPDFDPAEDGSYPTRWVSRTVYDVFEPDGTHLGQVHAPDDFSPYPTPVFGPDWVLGTTRDELGVQRVVRYAIEIEPATADRETQ